MVTLYIDMSYCYHPLKAVDLGINSDTGKHNIKVLKGEYSPSETFIDGVRIIPLPCGHCIGCRLKYSRDWADRCMLEAQSHESNYFLTLTYDDSHLPECQEGSPVHPLVKRDLQLFIKRLRKMFSDQKIRYFSAGEYGSKSMRPHYHIILFGLKLDDLRLHHRDLENNWNYYISDSIYKLWPFGIHILTDVTWETCAYVARYVVKKQKGAGASIYDDYNFPPEFTLMSRKPGIARDFFEENPDIVFREFYIPTKDGHKVVRSNRYFDKCFDIEYHDDLEYFKEKRLELSEINEKLRSNLTSLSYNERLRSEEINKLESIKSLKRKEI